MVAHFFAWLMVFAIPWQDMIVLPGIGTVSKLLGVAALGATVLQVLFTARVRKPVAFHWILAVFLCWILLSTYWAIAQPESIERKVNTYLQILVMVWVIWEASPTRSRLVSLLQAYVLGAYVAAGSTIYDYLTGSVMGQRDHGRFAATGFDANDLGTLLALALPMAWYIATASPYPWQRALNRAYFVIGAVSILLTGSRGAMITSIVALSVIPLTLKQMRTGIKVASIVMMILAGIAAAWLVPTTSFERLSTTTTEISEGTLTGRIAIWKSGLRAVPGAPLQGYGPGGWFVAAGSVFGRIRSPHNTYLSILVEQGMVGLLLFLSLFVVILARLRHLPTFERRIGLVLLTTLAIAITPLGWDTTKALWLVLALLVGWADVLGSSRPAAPRARPVRTGLRRPPPPRPAAVQ
ncbi:MAG: O-antigen ligase family protein [Gemmatimonadales bacterium]